MKYKEMMANNKLTTYIMKETMKKTVNDIDDKPRCQCGNILLTGETVCRYCIKKILRAKGGNGWLYTNGKM